MLKELERERDFLGGSAEALLSGPGMLDRNDFAGIRAAGHLLLPESNRFLKRRFLEMFFFPDGIVRVLHGQVWQLRSGTAGESVISGYQFMNEDAERPAVSGDVVHGHDQHLVFRFGADEGGS